MSPTLTSQWSRKVDQRAIDEYGMLGLVLMENAGRGCVDLLERLGLHGPVALCCGRGNNGGDGLVMARHLELRGYPVKVLLWAHPHQLRGDAAHNYQILERAETPVTICPDRTDAGWLHVQLAGAEWIVDALLGTGSTGEPRAPFDAVIAHLNTFPGRKLAVDLPSGLDCDSGRPSKATFRAEHTATFVAEKTGFRTASARPYLGTVHVLDIGAPRRLIDAIFKQGGSAEPSPGADPS